MLKPNNLIALLLACLLISSCSNSKIRQRFNLDYVAPDEFMVQKQKELVTPKTFTLASPKELPHIQEKEHSTLDNLPQSDRDFLKKIEE